MDWGSIAGAAGSTFGKGMSLSHENRSTPSWMNYLAPGMGDRKSPIMGEFGNFYRLQDEYEDNRQVTQQQRLNQLMLEQERASFNQRMAMGREHGLHPLSMMGVNIGAGTVGASNFSTGNVPVSIGDVSRHKTELSDYEVRMMEYNERIAAANARSAEADAAYKERPRDSTIAVGRPNSKSIDAQILRQSELSGVKRGDIGFGGDGHGSGDTVLIKIKPDEVTASSPNNPGLTAGVKPGVMRVLTDDGSELRMMDPQTVNAEIDDGALLHSLVNHGVPANVAMDIVGLKDLALTGLAGVAGIGGLAYKFHKLRQAKRAAEILKRQQSRHRWKGGE